MGRGKRFQAFRAAFRERQIEVAAEDQVKAAGRFYRFSDDAETRRFAKEHRCVICGGERKRGYPVCVEHFDEVFQEALTNIRQDLAYHDRVKDLTEPCSHCSRKTRYRCGFCQAKGVRPKEGYLWCPDCRGVGEWGSQERSGCETCGRSGYLSEQAVAALLGPALEAVKQVCCEHGRELRAQRLELWHEELGAPFARVQGLDISDPALTLRYTILADGTLELFELLER